MTVLLGALVGFGPQYEGSDDYEPAFGPVASVRWAEGYAASLGPSTMRTYQLRADVLPSRSWHFGPLLQRRQGRKGVDDNRVDDLENIDAAWEAGLHFGYHLGIDPSNPASTIGINIQAAADVSNTSNGWLAQPGLEYTTKWSQIFFNARLFSTYASKNYMQEYFGIGASNVRDSGLDFYNADAGFKDVGLRLAADYQFSESWSAGVGLQYIRLIGDAEDSPVTKQGSADQWFGALSMSYRF
ncbi:MAG: MipA/OmpV family protein [Rhodospirillales bacterium]|nr:MipA/OmpV family protein [Rhodospirillales bacterium]